MAVTGCPWCGMSGDLELQATEDGFFDVQVRCSNNKCKATAPHGRFTTRLMSMEQAEKRAIAKWNKRAPKRGIE